MVILEKEYVMVNKELKVVNKYHQIFLQYSY